LPDSERVALAAVAETAQALRLGRSIVYRLIEAGEIPSVKVGRSIRVPSRFLTSQLLRSRVRHEPAPYDSTNRLRRERLTVLNGVPLCSDASRAAGF
jgi:excisionase family DNA binding protein